MGIKIWQKSVAERPGKQGWILDPSESLRARRVISEWTFYQPSPLRDLTHLADFAGVKSIVAIDESQRMPLKSFKMVGAVYAAANAAASRIDAAVTPERIFNRPLLKGEDGSKANNVHVVAATDGNHGTALAWAADRLGIGCTIYLPDNVSPGRAARIRELGADTVRVAGTYDEAVEQAHKEAVKNDWIIIQDTALPGFEQHCFDIMHGYTMLAEEAVTQLNGERPTHVFVQAGVGGFAAATASYLISHYGRDCPLIVVVESDNADCVAESLRQKTRTSVAGPHNTMMAGIACGEVSEIAWQVLSHAADAAITIDDEIARQALLRCSSLEPYMEIGETGIAGIAAILGVCQSPDMRTSLSIDDNSELLAFVTEGITDPETYRSFVGDLSADDIEGRAGAAPP